MKPARPRKGTKAPAERNKRRGPVVQDLPAPPAPPAPTVQERLAAKAPESLKDLIVAEVRALSGLAEEVRLLRRKAAARGRQLTPEDLAPLQLEGRLRASAVKAAVSNREDKDDWGVDSIAVPVGECFHEFE